MPVAAPTGRGFHKPNVVRARNIGQVQRRRPSDAINWCEINFDIIEVRFA